MTMDRRIDRRSFVAGAVAGGAGVFACWIAYDSRKLRREGFVDDDVDLKLLPTAEEIEAEQDVDSSNTKTDRTGEGSK